MHHSPIPTSTTTDLGMILAETIQRDLRAAGFHITKQRRPVLSLFRKTR